MNFLFSAAIAIVVSSAALFWQDTYYERKNMAACEAKYIGKHCAQVTIPIRSMIDH